MLAARTGDAVQWSLAGAAIVVHGEQLNNNREAPMNWNGLGRGWLAGVVACAALGFAFAAGADEDRRDHERERLVVFGDSLSDPGNAFVLLREAEVPPFELIPDAPYARGGLRFSNGKTWVEQLAGMLKARPSAGPALVKPLVFSNYAVGGARARAEGLFDLSVQVNMLLADTGGTPPADALYVVFIGSNDVRDALTALAADPSGATSFGILQQALGAIQQNLAALYAAGAREFLVPNVPNLALLPAVRLQGPVAQGAAQMLAAQFNTGLESILAGLAASPDARVVRLDVFSLLNEVVAAPAAAGLTDVEQPCIVPDTRIRPFCSNPDDYLFWDGIHPTRAGHGILALRAKAELEASTLLAVTAASAGE
jgi:phospholipase/lecithinase/hemolysin